MLVRAFVVLSISSAFFAIGASAQSGEKHFSPQFSKCMEAVDFSAMKNSQFEACYRAELKVQDRRLNDEYKKLQSKTKAGSRAILTNGQKSWLSYRDGWCKYIGSVDAAPSPEVNYAACLVELTAEQVKRLQEAGS